MTPPVYCEDRDYSQSTGIWVGLNHDDPATASTSRSNAPPPVSYIPGNHVWSFEHGPEFDLVETSLDHPIPNVIA